MDDLISRQAAIDAVIKRDANCGIDSAEVLKSLPSAEPVIIRCKDCKHMIINEKHEAKPMICCLTKMCGTTDADWFCADGERKKE